MSKPRYIYITPFFPSPNCWRGAYGYDFVKALMRTGRYEVIVFKPGCTSDYDIGGIQVHTFKARSMPSNVFPFLTSFINCRGFVAALHRLSIDPATISVCHANTAEYSIYPIALKKLNPDCLTLLHHHNLASFGFCAGRLRSNKLYRKIQAPILRAHHRQIDVHVFISELCRQHFIEDSGLKSMRSIVLHNGVDTELFYAQAKNPDELRPFTIGTIANFQRIKGYDQIINALGLIKDRLGGWTWKIVGSGGEEVHIKARIAQVGLTDHVTFLPEVRHEALPDYYWSLDLFVMPSYWEGFGCVYTEAFACGVPFLASNKGNGIIDVAPDSWLIDPRDDKALADAILHIKEQGTTMKLKSEWRIQPLVDEFVREIGERL